MRSTNRRQERCHSGQGYIAEVQRSLFLSHQSSVKRELAKITTEFFDPEVILFFSDTVNFRKKNSAGLQGSSK